jgi:hypothetical protein
MMSHAAQPGAAEQLSLQPGDTGNECDDENSHRCTDSPVPGQAQRGHATIRIAVYRLTHALHFHGPASFSNAFRLLMRC